MGQETWIQSVNVIDVEHGTVLPGRSVIIRDGLIAEIIDAGVRPPRGFPELIPGTNRFLSPGLIDCHVHFFLNAGKQPMESFLASDECARMKCARWNAALAIQAGITTMRDCAAPAPLIFRLRREIDAGEIQGPHILTCGHALMRPGGHCHWIGGGEVTTKQEIRQAIEKLLVLGADFVKLIASGGGLTPGTVPHEADFPLELMHTAAEVGHTNGVPVTAHCHSTESIRRAIEAGLDMIEHANFLEPPGRYRFDEEVAKRVRDGGIAISPTVYCAQQTAQRFRQAGRAYNPHDIAAMERFEGRLTNTAEFRRLGIAVVGGTDCGATDTPFDSLVNEIILYTKAGFSKVEALRTVTSDCAIKLGIPKVGKVEPGYRADMLLLQRNPLENLEALKYPSQVIKSGKIVWESSESLLARRVSSTPNRSSRG